MSGVTIWTIALLRMRMLLALVVGFMASGCRDATIWSAEAHQPNGQWLAQAHTIQESGPGTDAVYTEVYLERTAGRKRPILILSFSDDPISFHVQMNWLTPSHLEITYADFAEIDFQAIKCGDIDISVREHTNNVIKAPR